jgi:hypothetical protein
MLVAADHDLIVTGFSLGPWCNVLHPEGIRHPFEKQFILQPPNFGSVRYTVYTFLTK